MLTTGGDVACEVNEGIVEVDAVLVDGAVGDVEMTVERVGGAVVTTGKVDGAVEEIDTTVEGVVGTVVTTGGGEEIVVVGKLGTVDAAGAS